MGMNENAHTHSSEKGKLPDNEKLSGSLVCEWWSCNFSGRIGLIEE